MRGTPADLAGARLADEQAIGPLVTVLTVAGSHTGRVLEVGVPTLPADWLPWPAQRTSLGYLVLTGSHGGRFAINLDRVRRVTVLDGADTHATLLAALPPTVC